MFCQQPAILRKYLILTVFFTLISTGIKAQSYNKTGSSRSYWQLNVNGGTSVFFGDIKQYKIWPVSNYENEWRYAGGFQLVKQITPVFGLRGQALYGQLSGTRRSSNKYFETNYYEFNLNTTISLRNIIVRYRSSQLWNIYLTLGIGITNYNTEVKDLTTKQVIQKVGYGNGKSFGGRTLEGIATVGLGLDFRLDDKWSLTLESANRIMNSDAMDGRISGFKYDIYNYTSAGIAFKFSRSNKVKNTEGYSYFKKKDKSSEQDEKDYQYSKPIEPPQIDLLNVAPVTAAMPVSPPIQEVTVVQEPVEIILVNPQPDVNKTETNYGLEYRVQISAKYDRVISIQHLSNLYNIPASEIKENTYNGYFIYTVGSFRTYEEARERRNQLRSYNGISDSFVVAFRNGQRLSKLPQ